MKETLFNITEDMLELGTQIEELMSDESICDEEREARAESLLEEYLEREGRFVVKLDNCIKYINELEVRAAARKEEAKRLSNLAKRSELEAKDLKRYIINHLLRTGKTKVETANHKITVRKSNPQVILDCSVEDLPSEYQRVKVEADKVALKKALAENTAAVSHLAHLNDSDYSIVIK